jgi:hypothetical protein
MTEEDKIKRIYDEIHRGHSDLTEIRKDLGRIFDKLERQKNDQIESKKDIEHIKELFTTKLDDMKEDLIDKLDGSKQDINELWKQFREYKDKSPEEMASIAKEESLKVKLWVAFGVVSGLIAVITIIVQRIL